ncbi:hypothetical protein V8E36_001010 [Tilletia maclaganii]
MSRLEHRETPLALADCSFDELIPGATPSSSTSAQRQNASAAVLNTTTYSLRQPGTQWTGGGSSSKHKHKWPSHANSLIFAPSSTLIVARAIHHDEESGPVLHLTFTSLLSSSVIPSRRARGREAASRQQDDGRVAVEDDDERADDDMLDDDEDASTDEDLLDDDGQGGPDIVLPDASLRILLPAPAVDSVGVTIDRQQRQSLRIFILTHGAQLFELSIQLSSDLGRTGLKPSQIRRQTHELGFLAAAPGWEPVRSGGGGGSGTGAGSAAMALVLGASKGLRGKSATQVLAVHAGLLLIACEDGTLVRMEKRAGSDEAWKETFLKPSSFLGTLSRLIPRSNTSNALASRANTSTASTTLLPDASATYEPTQVLALDAFANESTYALAFAVSRDRKLRIWGLNAKECLHTLELPRKRPDLTATDATGFGARAIARRALGLRNNNPAAAGEGGGALVQAGAAREGSVAPSSAAGSATGRLNSAKAPSEYSTATAAFQAGAVFGAAGSGAVDDGNGGSVPLPRIKVVEGPPGSLYALIVLVYVPVPATPSQARAESFFVLYGVKVGQAPGRSHGPLGGSDEVIQAVTPLWSCAAADEGEDEAAAIVSTPALRDVKLVSNFDYEDDDDEPEAQRNHIASERQGWTLWTAWNTLAGPDIRKTSIRLDAQDKPLPTSARAPTTPTLTQEEVQGPVWTSISSFACPSAPSSSSSSRSRFSPLHGDAFGQDLARAVENESQSVGEVYLSRLLEPGRFDALNLARAADWYEATLKKGGGGGGGARSIGSGGDDGDVTLEGGDHAAEPTFGAQAVLPSRNGGLVSPTTLYARLLSLIGSQLRPQRDPTTGATLHKEFDEALIREWRRFVDRVEKEEDASRFLVGFAGPVFDVPAPFQQQDEDGEIHFYDNIWSISYRDPVIVVANNRLSIPIAELPAETLLRIAKDAASDDLDAFASAGEAEASHDDRHLARRFSPDGLQTLAAALEAADATDSQESEDDEDVDTTSKRLQQARLLANIAALGLSVPRQLAQFAADAVLQAVSTGHGSEEGRALDQSVQDAWLGACQLFYSGRIDAVEQELRDNQLDFNEEAGQVGELGVEAQNHLAERRVEIVQEVGRSVEEWIKSQLFPAEAITGDEADAVDAEKASALEYALWLWGDLLCGPSRSGATPDQEAVDAEARLESVTTSLFGSVLAADGALRSLSAKRRLAHALLVVLLSLKCSPFFSPGLSDGDQYDPFLVDEEDIEAAPRRGPVPSLALLLSTTIATLQRIEGLYTLASLSPVAEVDPKSLLAAAELEGDLVDESDDVSFDQTVTRFQKLQFVPDPRIQSALPVKTPWLTRSLFHLAVQRHFIDVSFEHDGNVQVEEGGFAETDGEGDDHNPEDVSGGVVKPSLAEALDLDTRISTVASGLLSCTGLLGLHRPATLWRFDKLLESDGFVQGSPLLNTIPGSAAPRLEFPQARLARSIFNAGFPSAVLSYLSHFAEEDSPAIAYLSARAEIALGRFDEAESHVDVVAKAIREIVSDRTRIQHAREQERVLQRANRTKRLSPDDWEHAERPADAEGGIEPDLEDDHADDEDSQEVDDIDDEKILAEEAAERISLLTVLPPNVAEAINVNQGIPAVPLELFYRHVVDILLEADAPEQLIRACSAALEANAEVEAVVVDEVQHQLYNIQPGLESPKVEKAGPLYQHLFRAQLRLGRFADAYQTIMRCPLPDTQTDSLRSLVGVMCEQGQSPVLLSFNFAGLQEKVERELSFKARNSYPLAYPNYHNILHKYHVFRGDMKNAAATMYQLAQSYGRLHRQGDTVLGPDADPAENFLELAKLQAQSYLAALNDLALCKPSEAWFPDFSSDSVNVAEHNLGSDDPEGVEEDGAGGEGFDDLGSAADEDGPGGGRRHHALRSSAKRRRLTTYIPEDLYQDERRPIHMVRAADIRREYHLVLFRLELVPFFPEAANPSFVLGPTNAVSLFVGNRQFDLAFSAAQELQVDMTPIFQRLATICVALSDGAVTRKSQASAASQTAHDDPAELLKRRLDTVFEAEEDQRELEVSFLHFSDWSSNWDGPAADRAWDYLRIHLEMYDAAEHGWRYRQAVLDRCLALGPQVAIPEWLVFWFRTRKPDTLMRSYIQSGRVDDALREGIRITKDVSHVHGPFTTYVPYSLIDSALLLAEDPTESAARRAASPSVLHTRELAADLKTTVRKRFEALAKADKAWLREAERKERDQQRSEQRGLSRAARGGRPGTAPLHPGQASFGFSGVGQGGFGQGPDGEDEDEDEDVDMA